MHEWALAEAVLETIGNELQGRKNSRVSRVVLRFGELQSVDREIFLHGLKILAKDAPFGPEIFEFETDRAVFHCRRCDAEWTLDDAGELDEEEKEAIHFLPEASHVYLRCPSCRSPDFRIEGGRGVGIGSIEIEEDT